MRSILFFCLIFSMPVSFAQQIFKCVEPGGRVVFAQEPCKKPEGESEFIELKINQVGSMATPDEINQYHVQQQNEAAAAAARAYAGQHPQAESSNVVSGGAERVVKNCNAVGTTTFCRDSAGGREVTNTIGSTKFTKAVDSEGNVTKTTTFDNSIEGQ